MSRRSAGRNVEIDPFDPTRRRTMKILVGVDGGPQQQAALTLAARLAEGGELIVATVYPMSRTTAGLGAEYAKRVEEAAADVLRSARAGLPKPDVDTRAVANLSPPRALHRLAVDEDVDLLVIGSSHRGTIGRAVLGGTGDRLVHGAPCPVVVAPRDYSADSDAIGTITVAYDGGAESNAALAWAVRLAETSGARLKLIAVSQFPVAMYPGFGAFPWAELTDDLHKQARQRVDAAIGRLPATVHAEGVILDGAVATSIAEASADTDVLVAGSRGYGAVGTLLTGSVSRALMHHASCPVVVVPRSAAADGASDAATGALAAAE
jgi:nucleotide-binding universal stress UspA family protein